LRNHAPPETLFPLPVTVLEFFMWNCPQLVGHDLLYVVHSSKITAFEVEFEFRKKKKSHALRSGEIGGCRTAGIPFLVKHSLTEMVG
jgi:hypothetical protein